ncbi:MAG: hypothetical protein O8C66_07460 [Candidatus Methanoperedens sp.]|nr:hypothetical protein [Candidatus Methanoperedens sp.]MCZ7370331.1 hypothetical protein [Candidatus Methanoperedens sp.]
MRTTDTEPPVKLKGDVPQQILTKDIPVTSLIIKYILININIQNILFLLAFIAYGIGDGITAVYMMDKAGPMIETNPFVRFMYVTSGAEGVMSLKIGFTILILFFVWIISRRKNIYWTINGFLSALCIGGIMAMRANLMAANGTTPPSPDSIVLTFLLLTVLFVMIGDQMDKLSIPRKRQNSTTTS